LNDIESRLEKLEEMFDDVDSRLEAIENGLSGATIECNGDSVSLNIPGIS
jgi:hypothetical protein